VILYVSNAGVLLETGGIKVLVDVLNKPAPSMYREIPYAFERALMDAKPPFDNVDMMLITHHHGDHMDPVKVGAFARMYPQVPVLTSARTVELIRPHAPRADNLVALEPKLHEAETFSHGGVEMAAVSLVHEGGQYQDVTNLAFVFTGERLVRHVGDAAASRENLMALAALGTRGTLVAPFPYLALDSAFAAVRSILDPERLFAVHLPRPDKDRWNWIQGARLAAQKRSNALELCLGEEEGIVF